MPRISDKQIPSVVWAKQFFGERGLNLGIWVHIVCLALTVCVLFVFLVWLAVLCGIHVVWEVCMLRRVLRCFPGCSQSILFPGARYSLLIPSFLSSHTPTTKRKQTFSAILLCRRPNRPRKKIELTFRIYYQKTVHTRWCKKTSLISNRKGVFQLLLRIFIQSLLNRCIWGVGLLNYLYLLRRRVRCVAISNALNSRKKKCKMKEKFTCAQDKPSKKLLTQTCVHTYIYMRAHMHMLTRKPYRVESYTRACQVHRDNSYSVAIAKRFTYGLTSVLKRKEKEKKDKRVTLR